MSKIRAKELNSILNTLNKDIEYQLHEVSPINYFLVNMLLKYRISITDQLKELKL